ncbi:zinc finger protein 22-like [Ruditapes philippinarum]|uniref:zinc finger protein 22-like n=1 Tax=Ruditapes philippinarum TaxID=129788 RepID=UPI00295B71CF|nr:zinc finger protein 22-like [Ruditapes philippinarum]
MAYTCEQCEASFTKLSQLLQHRRLENHWQKFTCPSCKKTYNRKQNLDRHMTKHADENSHHCPECLKVFTRKDALDEHCSQHENQSEHIPANDLVRVSMDNPELDFPIVLKFMPRSALTVDRLLSEIERVLQSYEQFVVDETFGIKLVHVAIVKGSGYRMKPTVDITQMLQNKKKKSNKK